MGNGFLGGQAAFMKKGGKFATYDPAEKTSETDKIIVQLLSNHSKELTNWERDFLTSIYGQSPLTKKQNWLVVRIKNRILEK